MKQGFYNSAYVNLHCKDVCKVLYKWKLLYIKTEEQRSDSNYKVNKQKILKLLSRNYIHFTSSG